MDGNKLVRLDGAVFNSVSLVTVKAEEQSRGDQSSPFNCWPCFL